MLESKNKLIIKNALYSKIFEIWTNDLHKSEGGWVSLTYVKNYLNWLHTGWKNMRDFDTFGSTFYA